MPGQRGNAGRDGMLTGKGQAFGANAWNLSTCRRDRESAKLLFMPGMWTALKRMLWRRQRVLVFSSSAWPLCLWMSGNWWYLPSPCCLNETKYTYCWDYLPRLSPPTQWGRTPAMQWTDPSTHHPMARKATGGRGQHRSPVFQTRRYTGLCWGTVARIVGAWGISH